MEAILKREIALNRSLARVAGVLAFVTLTALGAFVRVPLPFTPVPVTLQTLFVLLSGAFLGARLGVTAQASYILLGLLGVPVFTGAGSGLIYLFGPTGGYLLGFVLASILAGRLIRRLRGNLFSVFCVFAFADIMLLACGTLWFKVITGYSWARSALMGFAPFVLGDMFKAAVATFLYLRLKSRVKGVF